MKIKVILIINALFYLIKQWHNMLDTCFLKTFHLYIKEEFGILRKAPLLLYHTGVRDLALSQYRRWAHDDILAKWTELAQRSCFSISHARLENAWQVEFWALCLEYVDCRSWRKHYDFCREVWRAFSVNLEPLLMYRQFPNLVYKLMKIFFKNKSWEKDSLLHIPFYK